MFSKLLSFLKNSKKIYKINLFVWVVVIDSYFRSLADLLLTVVEGGGTSGSTAGAAWDAAAC